VDVSRDRPIKGISWAVVSNRRLAGWKAARHGCALKRLFAPRGLSSARTRWVFRKDRCAASDADCSQGRNARDEWLEFIVGQISVKALAVVSGFQFGASAGWVLVAKEKETCLLPKQKRELDHACSEKARSCWPR